MPSKKVLRHAILLLLPITALLTSNTLAAPTASPHLESGDGDRPGDNLPQIPSSTTSAPETATTTTNDLHPRDTPSGTNYPTCTAITTFTGTTATITIHAPNGSQIGGSAPGGWALVAEGTTQIGSLLPYAITGTLKKKTLTLAYANDPPWTVTENQKSTQGFDCRAFRFHLSTSFWLIGQSKASRFGTLQWNITALDGTWLGGSVQEDIFASGAMSGACGGLPSGCELRSALEEVVRVDWQMEDKSMSFAYGPKVQRFGNYSLAEGMHEFVGTSNTFTWTRSGVLV